MRLIIFLICFFYASNSFAFVANIWDCKVKIPDSYLVDTRYEGNSQSVKFMKHNFLDSSGGSFHVRTNKIGTESLQSLKEKRKDDLSLLREYTENDF